MSIENTPFLRNILIADGMTCVGAAVLTIFGGSFLGPFLQLPEGLLFWAGVILLPFAALLFVAARRSAVPRFWLTEIVLMNALWVVASFGLLVSGLIAPNMLGTAFIVAQALAVALFTVLQASVLKAGSSSIAA